MHYFKHNDISDLETIMSSIADDDRRLKRDPSGQRRFVIVEGLYKHTGNICPLKEIMKLKEKYCYRLIMDESLSFGVLGRTGRGLTEHFDIPIDDVDMLVIGIGAALCSVGGVSLGSREVVDHQRLSGPGYCFSASAPPVFSTAALASLTLLQNEALVGKELTKLHKNVQSMWDVLSDIPGLKLLTKSPSPVLHLCIDENDKSASDILSGLSGAEAWDAEEKLIFDMMKLCIAHGIGVTFSIINSEWIEEFVSNGSIVRPSMRICVSSKLLSKEIINTGSVIQDSASHVLGLRKKAKGTPRRK